MGTLRQNKMAPKKKKGNKKKTDPFLKKEWFTVRAPASFPVRDVGFTIGTKSTGLKNVRDTLLGRCIEVSLGDLKPNSEDEAFRIFRLKVAEVHGKHLTTDKLRSLLRKWTTLIEAQADVKTTDGSVFRMFCIGFTSARQNQNRKTSYAQKQQTRMIRKKMEEIMQREGSVCDIKLLVQKLVLENIGKEIEKATRGIYPLTNVFVRKVKTLRSPKVDVQKLIEMHGGKAEQGKKIDRPEDVEEEQVRLVAAPTSK